MWFLHESNLIFIKKTSVKNMLRRFSTETLYETQTMIIRRYTRPKHFKLLLTVNLILFIFITGYLYMRKIAEKELSSGKPQAEQEIYSTSSENTIGGTLQQANIMDVQTLSPAENKPNKPDEPNKPYESNEPIGSDGLNVPNEEIRSDGSDVQNEPKESDGSDAPNELKSRLSDYIGKQQGKYGFYYINLITKEEFGLNEKDEFIAASTTKLPMNMLLYREIEAGRIDPGSILTYREENYEPGTGIIQKSEFGTTYTVREAARLSIVYSDNCAMNMIIDLLGIDNIRKYMQDLGGTVYYGENHRTCPYDLAVYAARLYEFYRESPEIAGILIEDLQNTIWNDRINKLLPKEVKVPHKIGNYPKVYNDVGIVFASKPYAIAVMSDNTEYETASDVIATISKMIYDYVE
jgi:beta-lactamase class A